MNSRKTFAGIGAEQTHGFAYQLLLLTARHGIVVDSAALAMLDDGFAGYVVTAHGYVSACEKGDRYSFGPACCDRSSFPVMSPALDDLPAHERMRIKAARLGDGC
jgi:hypothetical protein